MGVGGGGRRRGEKRASFQSPSTINAARCSPCRPRIPVRFSCCSTCNHTNDSGRSIACELKHAKMFGSNVERRVPPGDNNDAAHRPAPSPSPRLIYLISLRSRSFAFAFFFTRSFIHSSIHSFIQRAQEGAGFSQPAPIRRSEWGTTIDRLGEVPPPSPSDTPARGRNKKPGLPTDGDRPILQLEPSSSPRIGTCSSSSSWLTLARSMPTQQVIINKRLTN